MKTTECHFGHCLGGWWNCVCQAKPLSVEGRKFWRIFFEGKDVFAERRGSAHHTSLGRYCKERLGLVDHFQVASCVETMSEEPWRSRTIRKRHLVEDQIVYAPLDWSKLDCQADAKKDFKRFIELGKCFCCMLALSSGSDSKTLWLCWRNSVEDEFFSSGKWSMGKDYMGSVQQLHSCWNILSSHAKTSSDGSFSPTQCG